MIHCDVTWEGGMCISLKCSPSLPFPGKGEEQLCWRSGASATYKKMATKRPLLEISLAFRGAVEQGKLDLFFCKSEGFHCYWSPD